MGAGRRFCFGAPDFGLWPAMPLTSPPAQKALPAPVRMTTRRLGSLAAMAMAAQAPWMTSGVMEFIFSGVLSVMVQTLPLSSTS